MQVLLEQLRNPPIGIALANLSVITLPVAGTLLGLVYAGLIYWFQGALDRLEYTKRLLEDLLAAHGRVLLDLLVGASLVSLFGLLRLEKLTAIAFWIAALLIIIDLLRATAQQGYFTTLFSSKSIPQHFGRVRAFFRKLRNAGFRGWIGPVQVMTLTIAYPIWINSAQGSSWILSERAAAVFLLSTVALSLLQVRSLLLEAIRARRVSAEHRQSENANRAQELKGPEVEWDRDKIDLERRVIQERLDRVRLQHWIDIPELLDAESWSSRDLGEAPVLWMPVTVRNDGSCHLNIVVPYADTPEVTFETILRWTRTILEALAISQSEVQRYALSFFRIERDQNRDHLAIIRASRSDVVSALANTLDDLEFVRELPGRYFSLGVAP